MSEEIKPFVSKNIASDDVFKPGENLYFEASAGTGKTYTIQQIVSRYICEGTLLREILIVTYTEKAAGELKYRIRKKIEEVLDCGFLNADADEDIKKPITPEQRQYFEDALRDVDNARIFTIHSFCQKALRDYAYEAGKPFSVDMVSDGNVGDVVEQWIRDKWNNISQQETFAKLLKEESSTSDLVKKLKVNLVKAIDMYKGADTDREIVAIDNILDSATIQDSELSTESLQMLADAKNYADIKGIPGVEENLEIVRQSNDEKAIEFVKAVQSWEAPASLFDGHKFNTRTIKKWPDDAVAGFNFFYELKGLFDKAAGILSKQMLQGFIYKQIPELFNYWQDFKEKNKLQSYNDMILAVRNAVLGDAVAKKDADLCLKLRKEYKYAIIDEFQDTNRLQWDIFGDIFLGKDRKGIKGNSIIVVGDPKQSIYSFQGADLNVYTVATQEIKNKRVLDSNFRSTEDTIDACNELFDPEGNTFFCNEGQEASIHFTKSLAGEKKHAPETSDGAKVKPFLIWDANEGEEKKTPQNFAETIVEKIIEWCSYDESGKKTRLQVFDKDHPKELRNVNFRDFAVLARSRTELPHIETAFRNAGIPFTRYKDRGLFFGHECAQWIALFKAIDAPDFTAYNRRILNEALATDFFRIPLNEVESEFFDDPLVKQRLCIANWKKLAEKRRFAELQESIYRDTGVENSLRDLSKLQSLAKLHQIGNFAIDYLYRNCCSIAELVRQLELLSSNSSDADDDGNLVAKDTDFDAVQVMTIHASKGLEFPVVIAVAGWKAMAPSKNEPQLYHDSKGRLCIGLSDTAKKSRHDEETEEWKRLFYVAYTRASSVLVLPKYAEWFGKDDVKDEYRFLANSVGKFCSNKENEKYFDKLPTATPWDSQKEHDLREKVKQKILAFAAKKDPSDDSSEEEQHKRIGKLINVVPKRSIFQHSYSNLSGKTTDEANADENKSENPNGESHDDGLPNNMAESSQNNVESTKDIDRNCIRITAGNFSESGTGYDEQGIKFPKGNRIGNVMHKLFELAKFHEFKTIASADELLQHPEFTELAEEEFKLQALPIANHKEPWLRHCAELVFNTLKAELPEINGAQATGKTFHLAGMDASKHKAEMQFNFTACGDAHGEPCIDKPLQNIFKGFIDLMFVRPDADGNIRYSILDWKSDFIADSNYSFEAVQKKVDEEYSIQRVLYSFCLIKWLKQFYDGKKNPKLDEDEIFEKHFGGIYYAFVRGCIAGKGNGIYAQTWKDFDALQAEYDKIKILMNKSSVKESKND